MLSSAGWTETMRLCDDGGGGRRTAARPAFVRRVDLHSRHPAAHAGLRQDDRFYNDSEQFRYEKPDDLVDLRSGVVCSPNNFSYAEPLRRG